MVSGLVNAKLLVTGVIQLRAGRHRSAGVGCEFENRPPGGIGKQCAADVAASRQKRPFLPFENAAVCPEWFARTVLEYRHSADRVSPDARILRDLKA
jgi:hypothetical protein